MTLEVPTTLDNGAQVIGFTWVRQVPVGAELPYGYVLAHTDPRAAQPWVTWEYVQPPDRPGYCVLGHYFDTEEQARGDYAERLRRTGS